MAKSKHIWPLSVLGHWQWFIRYVFIPVMLAKVRYPRVLRRLRAYPRGRKLRVLFVTGTPAKWKCQSLYDLMAKSDIFSPCICQTICDIEHTHHSHEERVTHLKKCEKFFKSRNMDYCEVYSRERPQWTDLNELKPDIVFYNQPWDLAPVQQPHHVAKSALTFQIPYFVANYLIINFEIRNAFQRTLFGFCALNQRWVDSYKKGISSFLFAGHILPVGHTALDPYYLSPVTPSKNGLIIYAPHWSIDCPGNENGENYSTFLQTGRAILAFAQSHREIRWVFKPHPTLRTALETTRVWSLKEIDDYYRAWAEVGEVREEGYEDLFRASRALITDCGSFLTEYACTGNPIVHLISPTAKVGPCQPFAELYSTYYRVHDERELEETLKTIILNGEDHKKAERLEQVRQNGLLGNYAAKNVVDYLETLIFKKCKLIAHLAKK